MRDTMITTDPGTTKTRIQLLKQAKTKVDAFLGKYCFGTIRKMINILPKVKAPPPSHRDLKFVQGEINLALYHRLLR